MGWYPISTLVAFIINFSLTIFVYRRSHGRRNITLFANMLAMASIWLLGAFFVNISKTPASGLFWNRLLHIGAIMVVPTFFHFVWDFSRTKKQSKPILVVLMYAASASLLPFLFSPLLVKSVSKAKYIGYAYKTGPLYIIYTVLFAFASVYGVLKILKIYKTSLGYKKQRAKYILLSLMLAVLSGIIFFILTMGNPLGIPPIDNFVTIAFSATFAYAMLTYRLLDIKIIVTKIFLFITISVFLFATYSIISGLIFWFLFREISYTPILTATIPFAIFLGALPPLRKGLMEYIDKVTYGGDYNYRNLIKETTTALVSMLDLRELLGYLTDTINQTLKPERLNLFIKEGYTYKSKATGGITTVGQKVIQENPLIDMLGKNKKTLSRWELEDKNPNVKKISSTLKRIHAEIVVPLMANEELIGFLALDIKKSGKGYSPQDTEVLNAIASTAAIAIQNASLYEEAITDGLTGLYHHKYFQHRIREELSRAKRYCYPLSIMMIDIDHFKEANDKFGHQTGDQVLEELASLMKSKLRLFDIVARYGGEEFAVLLPSIGKETTNDHHKAILKVAERLRKTVRNTKFSKQSINVTISVGIAFYNGRDEEMSSQIMISEADKQLYQAKESGRDKICKIDLSNRMLA